MFIYVRRVYEKRKENSTDILTLVTLCRARFLRKTHPTRINIAFGDTQVVIKYGNTNYRESINAQRTRTYYMYFIVHVLDSVHRASRDVTMTNMRTSSIIIDEKNMQIERLDAPCIPTCVRTFFTSRPFCTAFRTFIQKIICLARRDSAGRLRRDEKKAFF